MLPKWDNLHKSIKNEYVKEYYDILKGKKVSLFFKRCFDVIVSLIMIILLSPVILILSIWIKKDSKGPVFYRQVRVTKNNKDFKIFKFRTMIVDADKIGALLTSENDFRITKVGNKLRNTRLDELPQLFNVLKGEMTFVGPRPEVRKYVDRYSEEMMATLLLPAGVTCLASIKFKDESKIIDEYIPLGESVDSIYVKYVLPKKMEYNLKSIHNLSFFRDIGIMFLTVGEVLK